MSVNALSHKWPFALVMLIWNFMIQIFLADDGTGPDKIAHISGPPDHCEHAAQIINDLLLSIRVREEGQGVRHMHKLSHYDLIDTVKNHINLLWITVNVMAEPDLSFFAFKLHNVCFSSSKLRKTEILSTQILKHFHTSLGRQLQTSLVIAGGLVLSFRGTFTECLTP